MTVEAHAPPALAEPVYVPSEWTLAKPSPPRDVALDLLRGLAIVILVVNHVHLESALGAVTGAVLSAAEVLVSVSGVVAGMVFGRRWITEGPRRTTKLLLQRSRKLYVASVCVVAIVGGLTLVPGLGTEALTQSPNMRPALDLYAFDGAARTLLAIVTLKAGPWQFNILGFFIAMLALAPAVLWALARGWWPAVLLASWVLFAIGRNWGLDVIPAQSERPFPILVWQLLFVHGLVAGWHRHRIGRSVRAHRRLASGVVVALAAAFAALQLGGPALLTDAAWARWEAAHFDKGSLDLARVLAMASIGAAVYLAFRRWSGLAERLAAPVLLPLGRNSFYVFIMHVFVCLAVASAPGLAGGGLGLAGNTAVELACVAVLWVMVQRRFLFRWVPR